MKNESPEAWRETVRGILTEMGVHSVDNEALNLLSLIAQQETCKLLKSCVNQAQATGRSEITAGDARVACRAYETTSFVHPRLFESNLRGLVNVINLQPLQPDAFGDPQLCSTLNLSAPSWTLAAQKSCLSGETSAPQKIE